MSSHGLLKASFACVSGLGSGSGRVLGFGPESEHANNNNLGHSVNVVLDLELDVALDLNLDRCLKLNLFPMPEQREVVNYGGSAAVPNDPNNVY